MMKSLSLNIIETLKPILHKTPKDTWVIIMIEYCQRPDSDA